MSHRNTMFVRAAVVSALVFVLVALERPATADLVIPLGGGWEATIFSPDENFVDIVVDQVGNDFIVIQKFAKFRDIDEFTGLPRGIGISFQQVENDANTVSRIIITDMFIENNTGVDWGAFREVLLGPAIFNVQQSASFSISPYTTRQYSGDRAEVLFSGGVVRAGDTWTPGVERGALVIDVDLSPRDPVKFILKELPVPAPGAIVLLGAAALVARRRRRD